jgi:hypothetical protein
MKLFCGHQITDKLYGEMCRNYQVRCPVCATQWRGTMVIQKDKGQAKKDLYFALARAREKTKEHFGKK